MTNISLVSIDNELAVIDSLLNSPSPGYNPTCLYGACAFHIQQACEKIYLFQIEQNKNPYRNVEFVVTHDLIGLQRYHIAIGIYDCPFSFDELVEISIWYEDGRYNSNLSVS